MPLIDTHCHVHFQAYKHDQDAVIKSALERGVFLITVGTQSSTSRRGLEVAERFEGVWATVGLHPNHTVEQTFFDEDELPPSERTTDLIKTRCETFDHATYLPLARHPKCVAIGECGLDYYRIPEGVDVNLVKARQRVAFEAQLDLADEVGKPVVIHCRDAHADVLGIIGTRIRAGKCTKRGVVHCFSGTLEEAQAYIALGFYVSFTGIITFPPRKGEGDFSPIQQVIKQLPLSSILTETDAPYLTPVPMRGKRNEPWYVEHVAAKIAELKGISLEEVARTTLENAKRLFMLSLP